MIWISDLDRLDYAEVEAEVDALLATEGGAFTPDLIRRVDRVFSEEGLAEVLLATGLVSPLDALTSGEPVPYSIDARTVYLIDALARREEHSEV